MASSLRCAALALAIGLAPASGYPAFFGGFGSADGIRFMPLDLSDDGSVVVGNMTDGRGAVRREAGRRELLGDFRALGVSGDGAVVVGSKPVVLGAGTFHTIHTQSAIRWQSGVIQDLAGPASTGLATSVDGSIVVGVFGFPESFDGSAVMWDGAAFEPLPVEGASIAAGVSADGSVIVGRRALDLTTGTAWRYENGFTTDLPLLDGFSSSSALAVSSDGSSTVGSMRAAGVTSVSEPVMWTRDGVQRLAPPGVGGRARSVSGDGSRAVGLLFEGGAVLWEAGIGQILIEDLAEDLGLDIDGWSLSGAHAISADGSTLIGSGRNPDGAFEEWILHLPEPGSTPLLVLGLGFAAALRRLRD